MKKSEITIYILISVIILLSIYKLSYNYLKIEEQRLLDTKYELLSKQIKKNIDSLILDKTNATLAFAIASSKLENIKSSFLSKNNLNLNFEEFSKELKQETKFKNIWFQLIDKEGNSFYRSWSKRTNDSLLFRYDVKNMIKNPKIQSTISVGRYDMTFKSMIPIFNNNEFIGIFEVITHFNSISRALDDLNNETIILADEKFYDKILFPFSNKFIDKYYISNINAKESLIKKIEMYGINNLLKIQNFKIIDDNFILNYKIKNNKDIIGYIVLFKKLENIDISEIESFKSNFLIYIIFMIVIVALILISIFYYFFSNKIIVEKRKAQQILDSQQNIIIITDGKKLNNANKQFLNFFSEYKSVEEFKKDHECICEMFIELKDENYLIDKDYDGKNWAEYTLENPEKSFKVAMKKYGIIEHFALNVNLTQFKSENKPYIVVTFTNITLDMKKKKELENLNNNLEILVSVKTRELKNLNDSLKDRIEEEIEKNKEKDRLLFQQNKMASMGEMLNNIAHQWRQPLSAISTSASSILLKNELNLLDKESLKYSCDHILNSSNYLTRTIEDFRDFFKIDKNKGLFLLKNSLENNINLLNAKIKNEDILLINQIDENIKIFGNENEFQQALLNILNNSIDALIENQENNKLIIVSYENSSLFIQDNGKGIDKEIIEHIFDPYFTTKHKSQGTGIGLYMAKMLLEKNMHYKVEVKNSYFKYNNHNYYGAKFIINFNK